jgi:hypothetical protein
MSVDLAPLFAPVVAGLVTATGLVLGAVVTGVTARLKDWLITHGDAAAAQAVASANAVIQPALQTGASVIAAKIASGELDYTNRTAIAAEAEKEIALLQTRIPGMLAVAAPVEGALVAALMGKIDAMMVAAPVTKPVNLIADTAQKKGK